MCCHSAVCEVLRTLSFVHHSVFPTRSPTLTECYCSCATLPIWYVKNMFLIFIYFFDYQRDKETLNLLTSYFMFLCPYVVQFSFGMFTLRYLSLFMNSIYSFFSFLYHFYLFYITFFVLERVEGRKREMERNTDVYLPLMCLPLGTWP